ncbi:class I SAM-dependent methyltransferase [Cyclobacterium roseum]|uniref:class I SAM-dependent methyltransferase n=1 Tax=Cyclobacterium roseum TaxID=2666137 RepID=UPI001390DFC5|nr:class I SAM-dependent methyltransferase [Cyclobacterium roseum]
MIQKIKTFLKNASPIFLMDLYRSFRKKKKLDIDGLSTEEVFSKIYKEKYWVYGESVSGTGSDVNQTNVIIPELERLFHELEVTSILDAPCGDFNWMNQVNLDGINYLGIDIVEDLIRFNRSKYWNKRGVKFKTGDIITGDLPRVDLILCRDCLVHFSFADIKKTLVNFKKSGSKYLLATSFFDRNSNTDIPTGYWRPLNLQKPPFNFPPPIKIINEKCMEGGGKHRDKMLLAWELKNLNI